jgi:hypothetical protein
MTAFHSQTRLIAPDASNWDLGKHSIGRSSTDEVVAVRWLFQVFHNEVTQPPTFAVAKTIQIRPNLRKAHT